MILVYKSPIDGTLKGLLRDRFTDDEWGKAKQAVAGLDTAVWMFPNRVAAESFDDGIDFLGDEQEYPLTPQH